MKKLLVLTNFVLLIGVAAVSANAQTFTKITSGPLVSDAGGFLGTTWGDYDGDGYVDLFVANYQRQNLLFHNDGDLDVFVTNGGISQTWSNFFYRNDGNQNKWITIQCKGTVSNTSAIGAMIRVKATIAGKAVWQTQQLSGQTGFLGQNSLNPEFGLGNATTIDSLMVQWPSGRKQVLTNVAPNQFLKIVEESTTAVSEEQHPATPSRYRLADNYPNPFGSGATFSVMETAIEFELPRAGAVKLEIYDLLRQKIRTLLDQNRTTGVHRVVWDGKNDLGKTVASGIYLYEMATNDFKATKRLLLIR